MKKGTLLRRFWYLALIVLAQIIPPYAAHGYPLLEWGNVNAWILTHPIKSPLPVISPIFQVAPLLLSAGMLLAGRRLARIFYAYIAISYLLSALLQNISISERYGLAVCTSNLVTFFTLAGLWIWAAAAPRPDAAAQGVPIWKYAWLLPALVVFWRPVHPLTLLPDFTPANLLFAGTGLSFCMVTPLYLAILTAHYPDVPRAAFMATSFTGVFIALGNLLLEFVILPVYWWIGVLHFPLLATSTWGLWCTFRPSTRVSSTPCRSARPRPPG